MKIKYQVLILSLLVISPFVWLFVTMFFELGAQKKYSFCGKVIEKFRTDAGYRSSPEAHVVFYCDSIKRNIDVKVTWNTLANSVVGKRVCFRLREMDIDN